MFFQCFSDKQFDDLPFLLHYPSYMSLRVEAGFEHLKDALAEVFAKEVEFPVGAFVTVMKAKLTANTSHARITLSVFPERMIEDVKMTLKTFDHEIKDALADRLRLRRIPRLHYVFDDAEAEAAEIERALHDLKEKGEL